jgi:hypothetical protein
MLKRPLGASGFRYIFKEKEEMNDNVMNGGGDGNTTNVVWHAGEPICLYPKVCKRVNMRGSPDIETWRNVFSYDIESIIKTMSNIVTHLFVPNYHVHVDMDMLSDAILMYLYQSYDFSMWDFIEDRQMERLLLSAPPRHEDDEDERPFTCWTQDQPKIQIYSDSECWDSDSDCWDSLDDEIEMDDG